MNDLVGQMISAQARDDDNMRLQRLSVAWNRYYGTYLKPLQPTKADPFAKDNTTLSLARKVVDTGAYFLFGQPVDIDVDDAENTAADEWLDRFWAANKQMTKLLRAAVIGGVTGDVFLKLSPAGPGERYPRVTVLDSQNMEVKLDPMDYERAVEYRYSWHAIDPVSNQPCAYRQVFIEDGAGWLILDQVTTGGRGSWVTTGETAWPFPWPPIFHTQSLMAADSYYGMSDIEADVIAVNDSINFILSSLNRTVRHHGHPKTWISGFEPESGELRTGVDDALVFHSPDVKLGNLEMQSDLSGTLAVFDRLTDKFSELVSIPQVVNGKVENIGQLSGLALQILYGPLVAKTKVKQMLYGEMLTDLCLRALELGGFGSEHSITIHWPDFVPSSELEKANTALALESVGVSKATLLTKLGYDAETEAQNKAEEGADAADVAMTLFNNGNRTSTE